MKYARGVTLTPEERRMAGWDAPYAATAPPAGAYAVTLPSGQPCASVYNRLSASLHHFTYPLSPEQRVWHNGRLAGSQAIQDKAQELAGAAFRQRQEAERKDMARCRPPEGVSAQEIRSPQMSAKSAKEQAGYYALCQQSGSGLLLTAGRLYVRPEGAQREARQQEVPSGSNGKRFVIGICCRWERRWKPAQWLALLPGDAEADADTGDEAEISAEQSDDL